MCAVTYTDNCDEGSTIPADVSVTGTDVKLDGIVEGCTNKCIRTYTLTATDSCSNLATETPAKATFSDTEGPTLTCSGAGSNLDFELCLGCEYPSGYTTVTKVDTCDGTKVVKIESHPTCCTDTAHAIITRTWNFQDSCGTNEADIPCKQAITSVGNTCLARTEEEPKEK